MLLVIFGAGASYDSAPDWPASQPSAPDLRFPLADKLFENNSVFAPIMERFPAMLEILPDIRQVHAGRGIEQILEGLQAEALEYPRRHRQLTAVRYYLQSMLDEIKAPWYRAIHGVTNYKTLIDQIRFWWTDDRQVAFVTFNYDTMLEDALESFNERIASIDSYFNRGTFPVFKVHGSVNWGQLIQSPPGPFGMNPPAMSNWVIGEAENLKLSDRFISLRHEHGQHPPFYPAIAIPTESKTDFVCPESHIGYLRSQILPSVTRILVIGWRGSETHFLELLRQNIKRELRVMVVAGKAADAEQPIEKLKRIGLSGDFRVASRGFSEFIKNREGCDFLKP